MDDKVTRITVIRDERRVADYQPGEIGKTHEAGVWMIRCPLCKNLGSLPDHQVREYEDGTITITPSLVCHGSVYDKAADTYHRCTAHYFIERNQIRWVQ